jgi:hypothetical protein
MTKLLNFHPILFQPEMVKANLAGRKTETRRLNGLDTINERPDDWHFVHLSIDHNNKLFAHFQKGHGRLAIPCPYGQPGDILWVRENFAKVKDNYFIYQANKHQQSMVWKPSIHMPKEACRMFLLLKEVKIERLQDITEESAIAEGYHNNQDVQSPYLWYRNLWVTIKGLENWLQNPWLWVLKYEVLSTTGIDELRENLLHHLINNHENIWAPIAKLNSFEITLKSISSWLATRTK